MSGNDANYAAYMLHIIINSNKELKRNFYATQTSEGDAIVDVIKHFVTQKLKTSGCRAKEEKEALGVIFKARTSKLDDTVNKNKVCEHLGMSKRYFYQNIKGSNSSVDKTYHHKKRNVSDSELTILQ
eukprot:11721957-Ditylum_brightwellii.AAC.2